MARKIAITLRKGGSGKTTTAVNLAAALHQMGQRVLLVDLDPQANATIALGINPLDLRYNVNHLFTTLDVGPREAVTKTSFGMDLLPSHPDLAPGPRRSLVMRHMSGSLLTALRPPDRRRSSVHRCTAARIEPDES